MHSAGHTDPAKKTPADEGTESSFKNMQGGHVHRTPSLKLHLSELLVLQDSSHKGMPYTVLLGRSSKLNCSLFSPQSL